MNATAQMNRDIIKSSIRNSIEAFQSVGEYEEFAEFLTDAAARLNKGAGQLEELQRQKQELGMTAKD